MKKVKNDIEVSVVMPIYNNPEAVKAIKSILNQEGNINVEIIAVDDGSKDDTLQILRDFKEKEAVDNLKVISQKNQGPSKARNRGIKEATGKYIAFLDSDDIWDSKKLKTQLEIFKEDPSIKFISTTINGTKVNGIGNKKDITLEDLLFHNYFNTSTVILEKSVLEDIGLFNENQKYSEDYDLWIRIASKYKCLLLNESFVTYGGGKATFGVSGLSSKLWLMEKGELSNFKRAYENGVISAGKYYKASAYSFCKYIRRKIIVALRK